MPARKYSRPRTIYVSGKAKWANLNKPDMQSGKYQLLLYPNDDESLNTLKDLVENTPKIKNHLKKDDDGYYMRLSCDPQKLIAGKQQLFRVDVTLADGQTPLTHALVGNGSDVTCKLEYYEWERNGGGAAIRLKAVRVDNLVEYNPDRDFTPQERENVKGLKEQPQPLF